MVRRFWNEFSRKRPPLVQEKVFAYVIWSSEVEKNQENKLKLYIPKDITLRGKIRQTDN